MPRPRLFQFSPCTSNESSHSENSTCLSKSVTGKFSHIDQKYHICTRVLGKGRNGLVRVCMERATRRRYAVKTIHKSDPSVNLKCLAREIFLMREMKHSNLIQLVDVFEDTENLHLVTELCEGGELFNKIIHKSTADDGFPCIEEDEAARIIHQIVMGVLYMHDHDVAHRDLKPENILFRTSKEGSLVKIIDFGLSRKHIEGMETAMTAVIGTPYYIPPEVLKKNYHRSCDLWSIGVITYIMLCGYPPFAGKTIQEIHRSILKGQLHYPSEDWKRMSPEARDFISQLLQTDPSRRMTAKQALLHPWQASKQFD